MPTTHVTSLELSRRLKELRVPQKSYFYWDTVVDFYDVKPELRHHNQAPEIRSGTYNTSLGGNKSKGDWREESYSAYLASELGQLLPARIPREDNFGTDWIVGFKNDDGSFGVELGEDGIRHYLAEDTECNARAKMLIYLIENHLISVEELGK